MEEKLSSPKNTARIAGFLYLIIAIAGAFSMMYVPTIIVADGAGATVKNILTNEFLFRTGIVSGFVCQLTFVFLVLQLYKLLKGVDKKYALLMVALVVVAVPIACLNILNQFAVLLLLSGADYLKVFEPDQLNSLVMFFLDLYNHGIFIAEIFWGLWLFPFGLLVIKSGFIPRILGVLLILGCFGYLIDFLVHALFPAYADLVSTIAAIPLAVSELSIVFWLLIKGVRDHPIISSQDDIKMNLTTTINS